MPEIKGSIGDHEAQKDSAPWDWRRLMLTAGFFCVLLALFIGAAMKEGGSVIPRYLALGGCALVVISAVASLINWISFKASGRAQPIK